MPLASPDATLSHYADHLRMLLAWQSPIESWLTAFTDGPQAALPAMPRASLIASDLAEPSIPAGAAPIAGTTWDASQADPAYRWGVCYVIEGSQLGGAVLHRRLSPRITNHPLRYLQGGKDGPGPRWQEFIRAMRADVTEREDIASACRGACDAFDSLLALSEAARAEAE